MYFGALEWFENENTELLGKKGQVISGKGTGENIKRDVVNLKKTTSRFTVYSKYFKNSKVALDVGTCSLCATTNWRFGNSYSVSTTKRFFDFGTQ